MTGMEAAGIELAKDSRQLRAHARDRNHDSIGIAPSAAAARKIPAISCSSPSTETVILAAWMKRQ
jgi:uncharacterized membrane protein